MAHARRNILMLAYPGAQLLDVTGPLQMFAGANDEVADAYRLVIAAPEAGPFATSSGVRLVADLSLRQVTRRQLQRTHTLLVAGGSERVRIELERGAITRIVGRAAAAHVPRIASVCTGAFFLAAAGLLDGRRATTHWRSVELLRRFRPQVDVDGDAIFVADRGVWTSAGVTAGMDLALAMIEADHGRATALAIARRNVVFRIRPGGQSQFSAELNAQASGNDKIRRLAETVTAHPERDWKTDVLASEAGVSQRSLSRLFRGSLNVSPADFVERVRIDLARRRLLETDDTVQIIAHGCGFGSLRRMDRAFARAIAVSPTEFRARFQTNGGQPWRSSTSAS